ncbi:MAG: ribosome biogenesis GTPase Der [Gammaproteobacteria bacterium]
MTMPPNTNTIAIVGRANVGKSMLFNRLCGKADAIVHARPGMTLDIIAARLPNADITLWDTAGIAGEDDDSGFAKLAKRQTANAIKTAAAAILVVDAREGVRPADAELLRQLRRRGIPRFFVVNKSEGLPAPFGDFYALGEAQMFAVSAKRGDGCAALAAALSALPPPQLSGNDGENAAAGEDENPLSIAIIGRPNVGKSTLINRILGYERMLVSDVAGTTRDSVRCHYRAKDGGGVFALIDTAGLRRRRADNAREKLSVSAARQTLGRAEVGLLMTDITTGATHQDKRIAALMAKSACAAVVLANKADSVSRKERAGRLAHIASSLPLVSAADAFAISARDGDFPLAKILTAARKAAAGGKEQFPSAKLTRMLEKITAHLPPPRAGGGRPKLRYAHQGGRFCIVVHGGGTEKIGDDYRRYLAAAFCRELSLRGAPMKIILRTGRA